MTQGDSTSVPNGNYLNHSVPLIENKIVNQNEGQNSDKGITDHHFFKGTTLRASLKAMEAFHSIVHMRLDGGSWYPHKSRNVVPKSRLMMPCNIPRRYGKLDDTFAAYWDGQRSSWAWLKVAWEQGRRLAWVLWWLWGGASVRVLTCG